MISVTVDKSTIVIFGAVKGLVDDAKKVRTAFNNVRPDVIAISVSNEELDALMVMKDTDIDVYDLSEYEVIYAENLKKFGEVMLPPPCYTEAVKIAKETAVPIVAIDIPEPLYTKIYCFHVTGTQYIRHMLRKRFIKRKKFSATNANEFVLLWDKTVNNLKGFKKVERRREVYMYTELVDIAKKYQRILAVIELERLDGVCRCFRDGNYALRDDSDVAITRYS